MHAELNAKLAYCIPIGEFCALSCRAVWAVTSIPGQVMRRAHMLILHHFILTQKGC